MTALNNVGGILPLLTLFYTNDLSVAVLTIYLLSVLFLPELVVTAVVYLSTQFSLDSGPQMLFL